MATVTTSKRLDTPALRDVLGVDDVLTSGDGPPWEDGDKQVSADVDEATLRQAIDDHEGPRDLDEAFRQALEGASSVADLKAALLGESGPGAEPRRG